MGKIEKKIPKKVQQYFSTVISGIKSQTAIKFFHGQKRPKSLSFSIHRIWRHKNQDQMPETASATLDDIDRYLFENFRSLYGNNEKEDPEAEEEEEEEIEEFDDARSSFEITVPALIDLRGSNRFFIAPVSSRSLIEEAQSNSEDSGFGSFNVASLKINLDSRFESLNVSALKFDFGNPVRTLDDCVAVVTVSASPYEDFLRSMADVMKAGATQGKGIDWDFMEELLFSYLKLNEKEYYTYVLRAFVDLVVDLRQNTLVVA